MDTAAASAINAMKAPVVAIERRFISPPRGNGAQMRYPCVARRCSEVGCSYASSRVTTVESKSNLAAAAAGVAFEVTQILVVMRLK